MAVLKSKEIIKMNEKEINAKIEELRTELIKSRISSKKSGKSNVREIKKAIARLLTIGKIVKNKENNIVKKEKMDEKIKTKNKENKSGGKAA